MNSISWEIALQEKVDKMSHGINGPIVCINTTLYIKLKCFAATSAENIMLCGPNSVIGKRSIKLLSFMNSFILIIISTLT